MCSIPFLPQQLCKVFSHWLIVYTRVKRLQHSPNLVDVGLYEQGNTYLQELHVILSNSRASLLELAALGPGQY